MPSKRNKETICATVSPYLKSQVETIVKKGEFSSTSDFVCIALMEFISKLEAKSESCTQKMTTRKVVVD